MGRPRLLLTALAVAVLVHLAWRALLDRERGDESGTAQAPLPAPDEVLAAPQTTPPRTDPTPVSAAHARVAAPAEPQAATSGAPSLPRSRVVGRVVNPRGQGMVGVEVVLSSREPWATSAADLPVRHETVSDGEGRFAFDVVTPTNERVGLRLTPGPYSTWDILAFGPAGTRDLESIRPGDNDLGDLILADAGALSGRVVDTAGIPIEAAEVSYAGRALRNYTPWTQSDEEGRFELGALPAGPASVRVKKKGFLDLRSEDVEVVLGQTRLMPDLRLEPSPVLAGRVVNAAAEPLVRARVTAWPRGGGMSTLVRSGEDGAFLLELRQGGPHTLGVRLPGYLDHDARTLFHPGSTGLEIVLEVEELRTLRVVERDSGDPVERFGFDLSTSAGTPRVPEVQDRPGGTVEVSTEAQGRFVLRAPGYADAGGKLPEPPEDRIQLDPGATLRGRFTYRGAPVPHPVVRIQRAKLPKTPGVDIDSEDPWGETWRFDVERFAGRAQTLTGEADGSFAVGELAAGSYRLEVRGGEGAPRVLSVAGLTPGEQRDLGEVASTEPASIHGVVVLTPGTPRGGLQVVLDANSAAPQVTDADGVFVFEGLASGAHRLRVEPLQGVLLPHPSHAVELAEGEARRVELNLMDRVPCRLEVKLTLEGAPGEDPMETCGLLRLRADGSSWVSAFDAGGLATALVEPGDGVRLVVRAPSYQSLAESEPLTLEPGGQARVELTARVGRLVAWVPPEARAAESSWGYPVTLRPADDSEAKPWYGDVPGEFLGDRLRLDLGPTLPGAYELSFRLGDRVFSGRVTVSAEAPAEVTLSPPQD